MEIDRTHLRSYIIASSQGKNQVDNMLLMTSREDEGLALSCTEQVKILRVPLQQARLSG